jgi:hypothetical protein
MCEMLLKQKDPKNMAGYIHADHKTLSNQASAIGRCLKRQRFEEETKSLEEIKCHLNHFRV